MLNDKEFVEFYGGWKDEQAMNISSLEDVIDYLEYKVTVDIYEIGIVNITVEEALNYINSGYGINISNTFVELIFNIFFDIVG